MLCRLRHSLPKNALCMIYNTLILPLFDNAVPVWAWTSQNNLNKLQKHQSRTARIIFNYFTLETRGIDLVHSLNWLDVRQRIIYMTDVMTFKCLNDNAPGYLCDVLKYVNACHDINTRNAFKETLHVPKPECEKFREAFMYQAPLNWNSLPQDIQRQTNIVSFKKHLKRYLATQGQC